MHKAPDRDKLRRVTRRRSTTLASTKPRSVKDLLSKAGLSERHITEAVDPHQHWSLLTLEILGPEWAPHVTRTQFEHGELTVWVQTAARAARVRLVLAGALLDGKLVLAASGPAARSLSVRVSR